MYSIKDAISYGLRKLGFDEIRGNQRQVVEAYLSGRDVLMVSPTGSGKSLTFHIAPVVYDYLTRGQQEHILDMPCHCPVVVFDERSSRISSEQTNCRCMLGGRYD